MSRATFGGFKRQSILSRLAVPYLELAPPLRLFGSARRLYLSKLAFGVFEY